MRTRLPILIAALGAVAAIAAIVVPLRTRSNSVPLPLASASDTGTDTGQFIVHEWGTFTSFAGADGIQIDFRPLVGNDLPDFVLDRAKFMRTAEIANWFIKDALIARQRMETPVTYFYTNRPRDIDVRVNFPDGLLTEFYPTVHELSPALREDDSRELKRGRLHWAKARIYPESMLEQMQAEENSANASSGKSTSPAVIPPVEGDNHYAFARETDSAIVDVPGAAGEPRQLEKFLFYRGVGNFQLPLAVQSQGAGRFAVANYGPDAIGALMLVHIADDKVWFTQPRPVAGNSVMVVEQPRKAATIEELAESMTAALVEAGLYDKEARAMVHTWQSSWFGEPGTRLLYLLPRQLTDEILPLAVSPQPDETLRVMVGRMEVFTPESQSKLTAILRDLGTCATAHCEPLAHELAQLGRFAEPALSHLLQTEPDEQVRGAVQFVLAEVVPR